MANSNYDTLATTTLEEFSQQLSDVITGQQALLALLAAKGFKRTIQGGKTIVERLLFSENNTWAPYSGFDMIDLTPQDPLTAAEFNWKQAAGSLAAANIDIFKNSGAKHQISSYVGGLLQDLETTARLRINADLFSDGTGTGGKQVAGLALLVEEGTAWSTVGGINSSTDTVWRNQWTGSAGSFAANGERLMRNMRISCTRGGMTPDLIITDADGRSGVEALLTQVLRITPKRNELMASLGFDTVEFTGTPVYNDEDCQAGYMYFLNSRTLKWNVGAGKEFKLGPEMSPDNQDIITRLIILYAAMTISHRAANGVITGFEYP